MTYSTIEPSTLKPQWKRTGDNSWIATLQEDPDTGELVLPIPDDVLETSGFEVGDTLEWVENHGAFTITKRHMEWVLVECVSTFRQRYMVQVPKGKPEWALDTVVCEEAKEFSQEHLGEQIVSHRVLTEQDALQLCDEDNDYATTWDKEQKMKCFFTKV